MKKAVLLFSVLVMGLSSVSCSTEDYDIDAVELNADNQNQDVQDQLDGEPKSGTKKIN